MLKKKKKNLARSFIGLFFRHDFSLWFYTFSFYCFLPLYLILSRITGSSIFRSKLLRYSFFYQRLSNYPACFLCIPGVASGPSRVKSRLFSRVFYYVGLLFYVFFSSSSGFFIVSGDGFDFFFLSFGIGRLFIFFIMACILCI